MSCSQRTRLIWLPKLQGLRCWVCMEARTRAFRRVCGCDEGCTEERVSGGQKGSEFVIYPDAPHAFHADYRPSYREQMAQDGWTHMLSWFQKQGVA